VWGVGCGVWGVGFGVEDLGFGVQMGCGVCSSGFRIEGWGSRAYVNRAVFLADVRNVASHNLLWGLGFGFVLFGFAIRVCVRV